jgi:ankyrin repeat protein
MKMLIKKSTLTELQNDETNESRSRPKRNMAVTKNEKGESKLHLACIKGNFKAVQLLIKNVYTLLHFKNTTFIKNNYFRVTQ